MRILLTDDAMFLRNALKKIIQPMGYEVIEAESGETAVEMYEIYHPDLVVMDITMPGMGGLEAVKKIKQLDQGAKIIMCSAMGQQDKIVTAIQNGALDFIAKPFEPERIKQSIQRYCPLQ